MNIMTIPPKSLRAVQALLLLAMLLLSMPNAWAGAAKLDRESRAALSRLYRVAPETRALLANAQGILVFPKIYKAGLGLGAELGKGALYRGGKRVGFYRLASGSVGLQLGAQKRVQVIAFMTPASYNKFVNSKGFKVGVDGSVVVADLGASGKIDSASFNKPIIGFVLGERGLMYNITLEGARIWKFTP
jgi:lipid-binding SYLF domain-containing protein